MNQGRDQVKTMPSAIPGEALGRLRQTLASIESDRSFPLGAEAASLPLGLPAIDAALAGGLACGALHEFAPRIPADLGSAFGFALAIAARSAARGSPGL